MVNKLAEDFLKERYFKNNEDWEGLCCRVANFLADNEDQFKDYFDMLFQCKAEPNSPALMNSGTELGYLSACNLVPVPDDLEGIMDAVKAVAMISKNGGGTGINMSSLRPTDDTIGKTGGKSSGVVSFLKIFDTTGQVIRQGGKRRSAQLGLLKYDHPDILRWLEAKSNNGDLETFNLSVGLSDDFFRKVENDEAITFINPRNKQPFLAFDPIQNIERYSIPARELFNRIAYSMWASGEPGVIYWDSLQRGNTTPSLGKIQGTNPCITGDTLIAVADGRNHVPIKQLAEEGKDIPVYTFDGERIRVVTGLSPRKTRENANVFKITLDDDSYFHATADHKLMLRNGEYIRVGNLQGEESLMPFNRWEYSPKGKPTKYWAISTNEKNRRWLPEHKMISEYFDYNKSIIVHHKDFDGQNNLFSNLDFLSKKEHDEIPSRETIRKLFGGITEFKEILSLHNHRIKKIEYAGKQDVYNLTVPTHNNYSIVTNENSQTKHKKLPKHSGIVIKNCGESPLYYWESCCLGSINLYNHLMQHEDGGYFFDYREIDRTTKLLVNLLNTVIDKNVYPYPEMEEAAKKTRKIGIGIMGLADCFALMGITYGSDHSFLLADELMSVISASALERSIELTYTNAEGPYPAWNKNDGVKRRNATLTSIAPTGSISFICGVSSGIEPFFKVVYQMNRDGKKPEVIIVPSFLKKLKEHGKEEVISIMLNEDLTPIQMVERGILPEDFRVFVTANEVSPEEHVGMQAIFQDNIDLAISKTCNLPHSAEVKDVEDIILLAHKKGCKGITVFRDDCFRDAFLTEVTCPNCSSSNVAHKEGCITCNECGNSLCSVA